MNVCAMCMAIHATVVSRLFIQIQKCRLCAGARGKVGGSLTRMQCLDTMDSFSKLNGNPYNSCWDISVKVSTSWWRSKVKESPHTYIHIKYVLIFCEIQLIRKQAFIQSTFRIQLHTYLHFTFYFLLMCDTLKLYVDTHVQTQRHRQCNLKLGGPKLHLSLSTPVELADVGSET